MGRAIVYVDGFNLYYGAVRGTPHKWLNLERYFSMLRQDDEILRIRYFTARVSGEAGERQATYLRALATCPKIDIFEGKFKRRSRECMVSTCGHPGDRWFKAHEEKGTDVSIAVRMLDDAYTNACDTLVLVTADSDLVPALNLVRTRFQDKRTIVYVPSRNEERGAAIELRNAAHRDKTLPLGPLRHSQFPAEITTQYGDVLKKPAGW
jgi:uncharacterized LabA/DUF88 family protein